jgi:hypothetical protein
MSSEQAPARRSEHLQALPTGKVGWDLGEVGGGGGGGVGGRGGERAETSDVCRGQVLHLWFTA